MDFTPRNLNLFETWLHEHGRSDGTARVYLSNLRSCSSSKSLTSRLIDNELAPKTRHTNLAALKAWANFSDDPALEKRLKSIRLPSAIRVRPKMPLPTEDWKRVVIHTHKAKWMSAPMRIVILVMALRGLRSGDALRMRRREVIDGLATGTLSIEAKGRKRRELAAAPIRRELEALKAITKWEKVSDLFGTITARSISNKVARAVKRIGRELKITDCHPHRLRRTVAVQFLKALGPDPEAVAKLMSFMDWSNATTALGYVDWVNKEEIEEIGSKMVAWNDPG